MQKIKPLDHLILILGAVLLCAPVVITLMSSTHTGVDIHFNGLYLTRRQWCRNL